MKIDSQTLVDKILHVIKSSLVKKIAARQGVIQCLANRWYQCLAL
jgi:hypothetical protein